jgi:pimeloyl-ACP methyl ester carboxylesterase
VVRVPLPLAGRVFPPRIQGRVALERFESKVLLGNPLGDPHVRELAVYTPPGVDPRGLPLLLHLAGFAGAGWQEAGPDPPYGERLFGLLDRLIREGACPPCTVVAPDGLTSLGCSQYVDSTATGPYASHVAREVLPWARERFAPSGIALLGQSSGGFGALHLALEYPGLFDAVGSSAGDLGFEAVYLGDFAKAARALRARGGPEGFLEWLAGPQSTIAPFGPEGSALVTLCSAACYSPNAERPTEFDLPFDWQTGELDTAVWKRWLAFDPVLRVRTEAGVDALRSLRSIYLCASRGDEWGLDAGARQFAALAERAGLPVTREEFDGGHFDKTPRYTSMLTHLVRALTAPGPSTPKGSGRPST